MTEMGVILDITRLIIGILILGYASYTDIKTRHASNMLWVLMGIIGAVLILIQYLTNSFEVNIIYLVFIPIMIILVYVLFQLRLIFGGADAKALMALAVLLPFPVLQWIPTNIGLPNLPYGETQLPYCWGVFFNALFIFLFIPLALFIFNIIKRDFRFPHVFLGYKMTTEKAREKFVWPLEKIENGKQKFVYMPKEFDIDEELNKFQQNNIKEIWVTPKIPFMIPLLFGFICAFIFGDLLNHIMNFFQTLF